MGWLETTRFDQELYASWDMHLRRYLNYWEVDDMGRLLEILDGCGLGDREAIDERIWFLNEEKGFSAKYFFQGLTF